MGYTLGHSPALFYSTMRTDTMRTDHPESVMLLVLKRDPSTETSTPGRLFVVDNGQHERFICYTLEDIVRNGHKIAGKTAIGAGEYQCTISHSARFKRPLPLLHGVPDFIGVRIHGGNTSDDTEGCILVGRVRNSVDRISICPPALAEVMALIQGATDRKQKSTIRIVSAES